MNYHFDFSILQATVTLQTVWFNVFNHLFFRIFIFFSFLPLSSWCVCTWSTLQVKRIACIHKSTSKSWNRFKEMKSALLYNQQLWVVFLLFSNAMCAWNSHRWTRVVCQRLINRWLIFFLVNLVVVVAFAICVCLSQRLRPFSLFLPFPLLAVFIWIEYRSQTQAVNAARLSNRSLWWYTL